jgi:FkbM family methyltransferase
VTGKGSKRTRRARAAGPGAGRKGKASSPAPEANPRIAFFEQAREYARYIEVEAGGSRFLVATSDRAMGQHLFVKQGRPEFRVLSRAVRVVEILTGDDAILGRLFVDIGANIGTSTVSALVSHRFGAAVSCEPEEENYRLLRANVALNDLEGRVRSFRVAVSSRVGSSELVVLEGRTGQSWIAVDRGKIRDAEAVRARRIAEDPGALADPHARAPAELAEMTIVEVEVVTLDHLAKTGVIEADRVGMVWIDAEGHEGHILEGAGTLADGGVPIVFEFHPRGLEERGDRDKVHSLAEQCYTHFVDVRRQQPEQPRFQLRPVTELRPHGDRLLDPASPGRFTDLLLLRLDAGQARAGANLPELYVKQRAAAARGPGAVASRSEP